MTRNKSKLKGKRVELQIAKRLNGKRTYGSNGSAAGLHPAVDIVTPLGNFQVKCRKKLPKWLLCNELQNGNIDGIILKEDYNPSILVIITLNEYLKLKNKK